MLDREPQDRADDLAEHRAEVGARVLGVVDLGPEPVWQTANPPVSADVVIQMSMPNLLTSSVQSSSVR
jgi:hypothetical protein